MFQNKCSRTYIVYLLIGETANNQQRGFINHTSDLETQHVPYTKPPTLSPPYSIHTHFGVTNIYSRLTPIPSHVQELSALQHLHLPMPFVAYQFCTHSLASSRSRIIICICYPFIRPVCAIVFGQLLYQVDKQRKPQTSLAYSLIVIISSENIA